MARRPPLKCSTAGIRKIFVEACRIGKGIGQEYSQDTAGKLFISMREWLKKIIF
jgi:hypothetical protein